MRLFCGHKSDGRWWFRILGYGIAGKDISKHPMLFSERYGYQKTIRIGKWQIKPLSYDPF